MANFLSLPNELQTMALSYVRRPKDLANVALTSKRLNKQALPLLYREVSVYLSQQDAIHFSIMGRSHPGLKHVRVITFFQGDEVEEAKAQWVIGVVLRCLQPDHLLWFCFTSYWYLSDENADILSRTQTKLEVLYARVQYSSLVNAGFKASLKALEITGFDAAGEGLRPPTGVFPKLTELGLYTAQDESDSSNSGDDEVSTLETVFREPTNFTTFNDLSLWAFDLQDPRSQTTLSTAIDFRRLGYLALHSCDNIGPFLRSLQSQFYGSATKLEELIVTFEANDNGMGALNGFLQCFKGLKRLYIGCQEDASSPSYRCEPSSITRHGETLEILAIDQWKGRAYTTETLRTICAACPHLQQLGLRILNFGPLDGRRFFKDNQHRLNVLSQLHSLKVLCEYGMATCTIEADKISDSHQRFAQGIFKTLASACPHLTAVAFGLGDSDKREFFARRVTIDPLEDKTTAAVVMSQNSISYIEPRSEILQFKLFGTSKRRNIDGELLE